MHDAKGVIMKNLCEAFESLSVEITFAEYGILSPDQIPAEDFASADRAARAVR